MPGIAYVDSSALVKLVVAEPESTALRRHLRTFDRHVTSALSQTEVLRAVRRSDSSRIARAKDVLRRVTLFGIDDQVLAAAAALEPPELRTLDALHIATALALGNGLDDFVTYDERQRRAAELLDLPTTAPA